jgi:hypothetical protein
MKRTLPFSILVSAVTVILSIAMAFQASANPGGSPSGYTGSPGDGKHCVYCHGGSAAIVTNWITTNIPAAGYTAGTTYTITATVSGSGKKGFEVSPQNAIGTQLGTLAAGTNNHLVGGTKYVTQNSSGSSSSTVIYTFSWTAPAAGTGLVTFYGAFCVGESNTKLSTTTVTENTALPLSATASATPSFICAGQNVQLDVSYSGGSGTYTFSWTSLPPGFTSTQQNPLVAPVTNTQYIVSVSDGANSVNSTADVTVNQPPTAAAGNDTTCAFNTTKVSLNGHATSHTNVVWTTSGTGTFSAVSSLSGNYFPSAADKTAGIVTLTLSATAQPPCFNAATDSLNIHFDGPIGIPDASDGQLTMAVAPNPTAGMFTVKISGKRDQEAMLSITDILGNRLQERRIDGSGTITAGFDFTGFPKGIYLVILRTEDRLLTKKLLLQYN